MLVISMEFETHRGIGIVKIRWKVALLSARIIFAVLLRGHGPQKKAGGESKVRKRNDMYTR